MSKLIEASSTYSSSVYDMKKVGPESTCLQ